MFTKFPFYQIYLFVGASFTAIGAGLLYTLKTDSYAGEYIGFQFVVGFGNGVCQQIPLTVVQAFSKPEDLSTSMSTVLCKSDLINIPVLSTFTAVIWKATVHQNFNNTDCGPPRQFFSFSQAH